MTGKTTMTLRTEEISHLLGCVRLRIDEFSEQMGEDLDGDSEWFEAQLRVLVPLERKLVRAGRRAKESA